MNESDGVFMKCRKAAPTPMMVILKVKKALIEAIKSSGEFKKALRIVKIVFRTCRKTLGDVISVSL